MDPGSGQAQAQKVARKIYSPALGVHRQGWGVGNNPPNVPFNSVNCLKVPPTGHVVVLLSS